MKHIMGDPYCGYGDGSIIYGDGFGEGHSEGFGNGYGSLYGHGNRYGHQYGNGDGYGKGHRYGGGDGYWYYGHCHRGAGIIDTKNILIINK